MKKKRKMNLDGPVVTVKENSSPTEQHVLVPIDDSVRLSDDIWVLIIAATVSTERPLSDSLALRTICKSVSVVTSAACNAFWQAVCENLRPGIVEIMSPLIAKSYQGLWFNLARFWYGPKFYFSFGFGFSRFLARFRRDILYNTCLKYDF